MITRLRSWYSAQPIPERKALIVWLIAVVVMLGTGLFARTQLAAGMSVYYYSLSLFIVDSVVFFMLYRQMPAVKTLLLTIIIVLELAVIGYYIVARSAII